MVQMFLTGLREGLEAALIVGIIVAFVRRSEQLHQLRSVWAGVGVAMVFSVAFAAVLSLTSQASAERAAAAFAGITSVLAVAFVMWFVFWMRVQARYLASQPQANSGTAVTGGARALAIASFLAVSSEGLETSLFLLPAMRAESAGGADVAGAFAGLAVALAVGALVYERIVRLQPRMFFHMASILLTIMAAGVLSHALLEFQEIGWLPGIEWLAFDLTSVFAEDGWFGTLLKGTLNVTPEMTWLSVLAYVAYLVPIMGAFLRPPKPAKVGPPTTCMCGQADAHSDRTTVAGLHSAQ